MDIDELFKENITIEEKPEEVKKEDINVGGTKSISAPYTFSFYTNSNSSSDLEKFLNDYYSSGNLNTEIWQVSGDLDNYLYVYTYFRGENEFSVQFTLQGSLLKSQEIVTISGQNYYKLQLLESTEDCVV